MRPWFVDLFLLLALPLQAFCQSTSTTDRHLTDRSIELALVVDARPQEVYTLWTTEEGVNRFFGVDARIDARPGGAYEIYFLPRSHPDAVANSTAGAKLLWLEPSKGLTFEWTAPPFAAELNTQPLPMWVEVKLEAVPGQPDRTAVRIRHLGFGRSAQWDRVYEFFVRGWGQILFRLDRLLLGDGGAAMATAAERPH